MLIDYIPLLKKLHDRACQTVFSHSANYLMTVPYKGDEKEWREAVDEREELAALIKAIEDLPV